MEIKFKKGDSVIIPEGCKAVINNGMVVFERIVPFKTGDILISRDKGVTLIFDKMLDADSFIDIYYLGVLPYRSFVLENFRLATEEEKQLFFDKMKEKGLRWNAEEKKVEEIKWQPQNGEHYFFVNAFCETGSIICLENYIDELLEKACNQLRTKELAEKAAEAVRETLRRFHEENKIE
jgi:hypothetical protein